MVPGWSVLSSGIHTSEDALKTSGHGVNRETVADRLSGSWIRRAAARVCVCVLVRETGGDIGGPVTSEMTHMHLTQGDHDSEWSCSSTPAPQR